MNCLCFAIFNVIQSLEEQRVGSNPERTDDGRSSMRPLKLKLREKLRRLMGSDLRFNRFLGSYDNIHAGVWERKQPTMQNLGRRGQACFVTRCS